MKKWTTVLHFLSAFLCLALGLPATDAAGEVHPSTGPSSARRQAAFSAARKCDLVRNIFSYSSSISKDTTVTIADVYVKWRTETLRSNFLLSFIPSLNAIKAGGDGFDEYYGKVLINSDSEKEWTLVAKEGTLPGDKMIFPTMKHFFIPDVYSKTLFGDNVLSPFNKANKKFYKYSVSSATDSSSTVAFLPRKTNTQLVSGTATIVDGEGRLTEARVFGNYDMMAYDVKMEFEGASPYPTKSRLDIRFKLLGNRVDSDITSIILPPKDLGADSAWRMDSLRPVGLTEKEMGICFQTDSLDLSGKEAREDSSKQSQKAWKAFGNQLFNTYRTKLGPNDEFSFKSSPLINPSYLSYSHRKGICYRMDFNGLYLISDNSSFAFNTKLGYMFNKHQFYFDIPFTLTYNERRHGSIGLTVGNGNRIRNSSVKEQLILMEQFFPLLKEPEFDYYTDAQAKLNATYDLTPRLSANLCVAFHQRSPVNKEVYKRIGQPTQYRTFSPMLELKYRPWKDKGPIFTFDYERGLEGILGSGIEYQKIEADAEGLVNLAPLSSLSMRLGGGFYASKSEGIYFLDYSNFRDNNLPGGWNDDWSGEFQLLDPVLYNVSDYYLRSNLTFEHPMLIASYIPWGGKFIETERLYVNTLIVERILPYLEVGYGFTNRFFSMGFYSSFKNWSFERVGFRFTVELFSNWN